jgi:hypothetical protein
VLLAAAVEPGWIKAISVAGLFLVTEPLIGQFIEPLLYGRSTGLSPISVVISAIFWGWLWGPIGLIISTPITLCLVVLGRHVEQLAFLQVLLGDQPALTKSETFYQRLLVGNTDELQEQAEDALKETTTLASYYDEVAMPGLELAARDLARGVLTDAQLQRIQDTLTALVAEFDSQPHKESEGVANDVGQTGTIRCVAGRTEIDFAVATILAQLLIRSGCRAEVIANPAVSRGNIQSFSQENVSLVGVCYIDFSGAIAPIRFLLRRLRQRLPKARLFIAIWPRDHALARDRDLQSTLDVTCVTSLQDAVNFCLSSQALTNDTRQVVAVTKS